MDVPVLKGISLDIEKGDYDAALKKAGVDVKLRVFDGCFHAFDLFFYRDVAKEAREFLIDGFMYAVENYFA